MTRLANQRLSAQLHRVTKSSTYGDKAIYYPPPPPDENVDEYGHPIALTINVPFDCSFTDDFSNRNAIEKWREYADIGEIMAEVRFDSFIPSKGGKIKIIERFGVPCTEKTYEIVAIKDRETFGYLCGLKEATA